MLGVPLARAVATALQNVVAHDGPAQDAARDVGAGQVAMALLRFGAALGLSRGLVPAGAGLVRSLADGNPLNQQAFGGLGTLSLLLQILEVLLHAALCYSIKFGAQFVVTLCHLQDSSCAGPCCMPRSRMAEVS